MGFRERSPASDAYWQAELQTSQPILTIALYHANETEMQIDPMLTPRCRFWHQWCVIAYFGCSVGKRWSLATRNPEVADSGVFDC